MLNVADGAFRRGKRPNLEMSDPLEAVFPWRGVGKVKQGKAEWHSGRANKNKLFCLRSLRSVQCGPYSPRPPLERNWIKDYTHRLTPSWSKLANQESTSKPYEDKT